MSEEKAMVLKEPRALANLGEVQQFADTCFKSGLFPDCKSPQEAIMKVVAGRELGIPALMSLQKLYIVNGKMGMAGEVAIVLLQRAGYKIDHKYDSRDNPTACEVTLTHPQKGSFAWRFTIADAKRAGLVKPNSAWEKFPQDLLYYRALMGNARKFAPEALGGIGYTPEELQSITIVEDIPKAPPTATTASTEGIKPSPSTNPLVNAAKQAGAVEIPNFPKLNKKGVSLDFCWIHDNADWKPNKFGKLSHKTQDGWCNFSEAIKPVVAEVAKAQGWDAGTMNDIIKEKYEGRTWSKLSEEEQCLFLESLITE